jgi:hypothetical protein
MPPIIRGGRYRLQRKTGNGIVNSLINSLPVELHIPGYQYCGPGTKVLKRVARGDQGINQLDAACKKHDLAYLHNRDDLRARHRADYELEQSAWKQVKSKDSSVGEKGAAWLVTNIMKTKQRFGMGVASRVSKSKKCGVKKNRRCSRRRSTILKKKGSGKRMRLHKLAFGSAIRRPVRDELLKAGGKKMMEKSVMRASKIAITAARKSLKAAGGKRKIRTPRVIPIPKTGGLLPLIPIFAGLSALGSLAGGAAGIVRAIKDVKRKGSGEKTGGTLQLSTRGNGLFLKPYRSGLGLFMNHKSKN